MALTLEANYSKKIGLPSYSSHQFSITIKTELTDPAQVQAETSRLYALLQNSVDQSLQKMGWLPDPKPANGNGGNGHSNGNGQTSPPSGNGNSQGSGRQDFWNCSPKQRDLIQKIVDENQLDKTQVDQLAQDRFGKGVRQLNKLEASGLIDELFERHGGGNGNGGTRRRLTNDNNRTANTRPG